MVIFAIVVAIIVGFAARGCIFNHLYEFGKTINQEVTPAKEAPPKIPE